MFLRFKKSNIYFVLFGFWILVLAFALRLIPQLQLFTLINRHRSFISDLFFTFFTELGSGWILVPILIYLIYKKKYKTILSIAIILLVNSLTISCLKHYFYMPRPILCYGSKVVESAPWVTIYEKYSFPSGHTALSFAIATYVSFLSSKKGFKALCFLIAALVGYSRVYLGEHFVFDVFFGSMIGTSIACIYYFSLIAIEYFKGKKAVVIKPII